MPPESVRYTLLLGDEEQHYPLDQRHLRLVRVEERSRHIWEKEEQANWVQQGDLGHQLRPWEKTGGSHHDGSGDG